MSERLGIISYSGQLVSVPLLTTERFNRIYIAISPIMSERLGIISYSGQLVSVTLLTTECFNRIYTAISPITPERLGIFSHSGQISFCNPPLRLLAVYIM